MFSVFIYNESLPMNSINFSKFANALIRKDKKPFFAAASEKRKSWTLFYNRFFYKVLRYDKTRNADDKKIFTRVAAKKLFLST